MKVAHINTMDYGGAFNAAYRIYHSIQKNGVNCTFLVGDKHGNHSDIISFPEKGISFFDKFYDKLRFKPIPSLDSYRINTYRESKYEGFRFSRGSYNNDKIKEILNEFEIIHLHWVADILDWKTLAELNKPIVWTLHDMNPFTGGCHYSLNCTAFETGCTNCPGMTTQRSKIRVLQDFERKLYWIRQLENKNISIVSPSKWLHILSSTSLLFKDYRNVYIPYSISEQKFQKKDKFESRCIYDIPFEKRIVLFVAGYTTFRKGFDLLFKAFQKIIKSGNDVHLAYAGPKMDLPTNDKIHYLGYAKDETSLSIVYSLADVVVVPSIEDNLPNTVLESLICGCPVVGFNIGGMPDMINESNGKLVNTINCDSLGNAIMEVLDQCQFDPMLIRKSALEKYNEQMIGAAYSNLYFRIASV